MLTVKLNFKNKTNRIDAALENQITLNIPKSFKIFFLIKASKTFKEKKFITNTSVDVP